MNATYCYKTTLKIIHALPTSDAILMRMIHKMQFKRFNCQPATLSNYVLCEIFAGRFVYA